MAVKVATKLTLPKKFLAQALVAKNTSLYKDRAEYAGYNYEEDIFPQVRLAFKKYNALYDTNEKLTEYFARDFNRKDAELFQQIEQKTASEAGQTSGEPSKPTSGAEQATNTQPLAASTSSSPTIGASGLTKLPAIPTIPPRVITEIPQVTEKEAMDKTEASKQPQTKQTSKAQTTSTPQKTSTKPSIAVSESTNPSFKTKQAQPATPTLSSAKLNLPALRFRIANLAENVQRIAAPSGPFLKTNLNRISQGLWNIGKSSTANVYNLGARTGNRALDTFGGIPRPGNIGSGSRSILGKLGRFGKGKSRGISPLTKIAKNRGKWIVILLVLGMFFLTGFTAFTGIDQTSTIPTNTLIRPSGISSCQFTRAGSSSQYQSPLLLSYIQEAAQKANIPAVVLAAFIRVESPSASNMSDDQITSYAANCAESKTGALGIMQIQPPGTKSEKGNPASCDNCIDAGAKLVGKTAVTMTRADYCDPRTSIIVGAGWILEKMRGLGLGDGAKWDPAWTNNRTAIETLVNTYYGGVLYPDYNTGPYNYADDVSTSIQSCQSTATIPASPTLNSALAWDQQIVSGLTQGVEDLFSRLLTAVSNGIYSTGTWASTKTEDIYYCTYSIIDAYNLAGISGLTKGAHGAVVNMRKFWQSPQASSLGYKYLDYQNDHTILKNIQPGYVIFMESVPGTTNGREHAAMVNEVSLPDGRGNGYIKTYDSNNTKIDIRYDVDGWVIQNAPYTVVGFGGV